MRNINHRWSVTERSGQASAGVDNEEHTVSMMIWRQMMLQLARGSHGDSFARR